MGRHVAARVDEDFGDVLFDTAVPRTTRLSEMALRGKPAVIYDRRSAGSRAYFDLADELVAALLSGRGDHGHGQESSIPDRADPLATADDRAEEIAEDMAAGDDASGRAGSTVPGRPGSASRGARVRPRFEEPAEPGNGLPGRPAGRGRSTAARTRPGR